MTKQEGFFSDGELEGRDPRGFEIYLREHAASQREARERERLKRTMVTRDGFSGSVTKSAWEWKQLDKKRFTIRTTATKPNKRK